MIILPLYLDGEIIGYLAQYNRTGYFAETREEAIKRALEDVTKNHA